MLMPSLALMPLAPETIPTRKSPFHSADQIDNICAPVILQKLAVTVEKANA